MKKLLSVLLVLLMCLSVCLVSCDEDDPNEVEITPVSKDEAVEIFNDFAKENPLKDFKVSPNEILDDTKLIALGATGSLKIADQDAGEATIAIKDNVMYVKNSASVDPAIAAIVGDSLVFFSNNSGEWVANTNPMYSASSYTEYIDMAESMLTDIKLPEITAADITEENGMMVLNLDYIIKLIEANKENTIISAYFPSEGDAPNMDEIFEETIKEVKDVIKALGYKISFVLNGEKIYKLQISINPDDSEIGKEFKEETFFKSFTTTLEYAANGETLKKFSLNVVNDFSKYEAGFTPSTTIEMTSVLDENYKPVSSKLDVTAYSNEINYGYPSISPSVDDSFLGDLDDEYLEGEFGDEYFDWIDNTDTVNVNIQKIKFSVTCNQANLNKSGAEVLKASFDITHEKKYEITTTYDDNGDVATTESKKLDPDMEKMTASAKVTSGGENKLNIAASLKQGDMTLYSLTASTTTNEAVVMPTLPEFVQNYINEAK